MPCAMKVRTDQGPVIQTLPVQSVICVPGNRETLSAETDTVTVKGLRGVVLVAAFAESSCPSIMERRSARQS